MGAHGPMADSFAHMFLVPGLSHPYKPVRRLGPAAESRSISQQI